MTELRLHETTREGTAPFRARARLIRLLGEELISDEVMALVELVKNAYDADAKHVVIRFCELADPTLSCIEVCDDGTGMNLDTVLHCWLEPATDNKRSSGRRRRTSLGRIPLGEKGVGRFAADKIGGDLELVTRMTRDVEEVVLQVAWHHYEGTGYLDQVENQWHVRHPRAFMGSGDASHGTIVRMRHLRARWDEDLLRRVRDGLTQLIPPNATISDFAIEFDCPDFPSLSGPITSDLLERAPYRLVGRVDEHGVFTEDMPGPCHSMDVRVAARSYFTQDDGSLRDPACGPFRISLYVWDLDPGGLRRAGMDRAQRDVLRRTSGVRIYRDGFRVWPYGERDDDWLELNQRRVNNPTLRVSNNQIIGYIEITRHDNPDLRDRTSREGLIDTAAFFDLRALALGVLERVEEARFGSRHEETPPISARTEDDPVLRRVQAARADTPGTGWKAALQDIERTYRQQLQDQRSRYDYVAGLAGLGLAAGHMVTALTETVSDASTCLQVLRNEMEATRALLPETHAHRLEGLAMHLERLEHLLDLMEPMMRVGRRIPEPLDVATLVQDTFTLFEREFNEIGITPCITQDGRAAVRMVRAHLLQVLMCLTDNAIRALSHPRVSPAAIRCHVWSRSGRSGLIFSDSGPGIASSARKLIFQPFYAGRRDGAGLGLYVARDILARYDATLDLTDDEGFLPGATFAVNFGRRQLKGGARTADAARTDHRGRQTVQDQ